MVSPSVNVKAMLVPARRWTLVYGGAVTVAAAEEMALAAGRREPGKPRMHEVVPSAVALACRPWGTRKMALAVPRPCAASVSCMPTRMTTVTWAMPVAEPAMEAPPLVTDIAAAESAASLIVRFACAVSVVEDEPTADATGVTGMAPLVTRQTAAAWAWAVAVSGWGVSVGAVTVAEASPIAVAAVVWKTTPGTVRASVSWASPMACVAYRVGAVSVVVVADIASAVAVIAASAPTK